MPRITEEERTRIEVDRINKLISSGVSMKKEAERITGIPIFRIKNYARHGLINFPNRRWTNGKIGMNRELIDDMILDGMNSREIGDRIGVKRQYIDSYIKDGLQDIWKEAKKERAESKRDMHLYQTIADLVLKYTLDRARESDVEEAVLYYLGKEYIKSKSRISLENLISLVRVYKFSRENEPLSFMKIAEASGIGYGYSGASLANQILKKMRFKSLKWSTRATSQEKIGSIKRAAKEINYFSFEDIAYFLDVNVATLRFIAKRNGVSRDPKNKSKKGIIRFGNTISG